MCREVNSRPSLPARGEVLTENIMEMVGSSTVITGQGPGVFGVGQGVADEGRRHPGHRGDISRGDDLPGGPVQTVVA